MNKKYRFYYHYFRQYKCMSIHFKNKCYKVNNIECNVASNTKWNKTMPNLVMQGFCEEVIIDEDKAIIN